MGDNRGIEIGGMGGKGKGERRGRPEAYCTEHAPPSTLVPYPPLPSPDTPVSVD